MRRAAFIVLVILAVPGSVLGQAREMGAGELANHIFDNMALYDGNTGKRLDTPIDTSPAQTPGWVADAESARQGWKTAGKAGSAAGKVFGLGESLYDFLGAYEGLSNMDTTYDPDFDPDGGPQVPSRCADPGSDCGACYTRAVKEIDFIRFYLEKLRAIAKATIDMSDKAISFGNNASGFHGMMGMSWQLSGKPQIEEAVAGLRKTYARKYQAYIRNLKQALQQLSACEAEHFGEEDWYARYGFIYYEFMRARYETPD